MTLPFRDQRRAASLRYRNRAEINRSYVWTESLSGMVFVPAQKLSGIRVWTPIPYVTLVFRDRHGAVQLRSLTKIAPKSPFLCVNRIPIWYGFRASTKAIWKSGNIALVGLGIALFIFFVVGVHVWKQSQYGHHKMGKWDMSESGPWLLQSVGAVRETFQSKLETWWGKESKLALRS